MGRSTTPFDAALDAEGAGGLSDDALLRIALGSRAAAAAVAAWMGARGGPWALARARPSCLATLAGVGPGRARRLLASIALGRRSIVGPSRSRPRVERAEDVWRLVGAEMASLSQERVRVLLLDARGRLIHVAEVHRGTATAAPVRLAEVFRPAISAGAVQLVLVHNHPSGDCTPSEADRALWVAAERAGALLGIAVVDHVVVAENGWASARVPT